MTKYGLRINALASRSYPCWSSRSDFKNGVSSDPTLNNPPVLSIFSNFLSFNCKDHGIQAEEMGHTLFTNLTLV